MIKKFIKIQGTGRFLNYQHKDTHVSSKMNEFGKFNLIYAENGSGKTTLAVILKSLSGNNELLLNKRSFDQSVPQEIEILTDLPPNPKITFSDQAWDRHYSPIEVFDIHFITQNIYAGLEIQNDHKKNLFEIIFGDRGVKLKTEIQHLKERIEKGNKTVRETKNLIETAIEQAYEADSYLKIDIDSAIDQKISVKFAKPCLLSAFSNMTLCELGRAV